MTDSVAWIDEDLEIHFGRNMPEHYGKGWKPLYPESALNAERERADIEAANGEHWQNAYREWAETDAMMKAYLVANERAEKAEAALARVREEYRSLAKQAAADVMDWGAYASEYFQQKYDLAGDIAKYQAIAADKGAEYPPSVCVPVEPTEEMLNAMHATFIGGYRNGLLPDAYHAMLTAARKP